MRPSGRTARASHIYPSDMPAPWRTLLAAAANGQPPEAWQELLNDAMEDGKPATLGTVLKDLKSQGVESASIAKHMQAVRTAQQAAAATPAPAAPLQHREHSWLKNDPTSAGLMVILEQMQEEWVSSHPQSSLILKKVFPTTRSEALKIKFSALDRFYKLVPPEGRNAFEIMNDRCPMVITKSVAYLLLNYVAHYRQFLVQHGRHLCVIKCYVGREETHIWFMPLDKVKECLEAQSESLRQGISHNDLQLVQSYPVRSTLAIHTETWEVRSSNGGGGRRGGGSNFGEISWIGGSALHYAAEDGEARDASQAFAHMSVEEVTALSKRKQRLRERGGAEIAADLARDEGVTDDEDAPTLQ